MNKPVEGKRVGILATDGFEESELQSPNKILEEGKHERQVA